MTDAKTTVFTAPREHRLCVLKGLKRDFNSFPGDAKACLRRSVSSVEL